MDIILGIKLIKTICCKAASVVEINLILNIKKFCVYVIHANINRPKGRLTFGPNYIYTCGKHVVILRYKM